MIIEDDLDDIGIDLDNFDKEAEIAKYQDYTLRGWQILVRLYIPKKSASAFNTLTYRLAIIYKLKDNYGPSGDPLFERFKDTFGDEKTKAVAALKKWESEENQQVKYRQMTYDDQNQYRKYLSKLYAATRTGGGEITFKSSSNKDVQDKTINANF